VAASQHIHFTATLQDSDGVKASKTSQLFIDPAQTITAAVTALNAWIALLTAITGSKVVRQGIALSVPVTVDQTGKPTADASNSETVTIDFDQAGLSTHYGDNIPAFLESKLTGEQVNLADTDVAAYTALLAGTAVLGGTYSGLGNEALTAVYRAFQGDRSHRRQLFGKSVTYP
jgi:hypothetical protein